jgi:hypothetical protein
MPLSTAFLAFKAFALVQLWEGQEFPSLLLAPFGAKHKEHFRTL